VVLTRWLFDATIESLSVSLGSDSVLCLEVEGDDVSLLAVMSKLRAEAFMCYWLTVFCLFATLLSYLVNLLQCSVLWIKICICGAVYRISVMYCSLKMNKCKVKVKFSHTRYRVSGLELIPVYRQSDCRWLFKSSASGSLPLLSARPVITFSAEECRSPLTRTKLHCSLTETHWCEQLAQGCYAAAPSENWTHDLTIASPML